MAEQEAGILLGAALQRIQDGAWEAGAQLCRDGLLAAEREGAPDAVRADLLHLLAGVTHQAGDTREALDLLRQALALNPAAPGFHFTHGLVLQALGENEAAAAAYRCCLALKPDFASAQGQLGALLLESGRHEAARDAFRAALRLAPEEADLWTGLALALDGMGRVEEALEAFGATLRLRPEAEAACHLAALLQRIGRADMAIPVYRVALRLRPDHVDAQAGLGGALFLMGKIDEALAVCQEAVGLQPAHAPAWCNLGGVLRDLGQVDAAIAAFRTALSHCPGFEEAESNLGMAQLARGDWAEGWQNFQGQRLHRMAGQDRPDQSPRTWTGGWEPGKTLLIRAEHGFGDTLQFCRLARLPAARGMHVVLEVQKPLRRLLGSLPGVDAVIACGDEPPPCDLQCPTFALPLALGLRLEEIPRDVPYLHADPVQRRRWAERLEATGRKGKRIGLAWAGKGAKEGSFHRAMDRCRSMAPEQLAPLLAVPGLHFISLQKTPPLAPEEYGLTDFMTEMTDFADTAALVENLDLVITIDSAVAHLAGALGRPVWLMDRFNHCWRWLDGRSDTPWYPEMRIYRQPRRGDWGAVVAEMARDLRTFAAPAPSVAASPSPDG